GLTTDVRALIGPPARKSLRSRRAGPGHWRGDGVPTGGSGASAGSGVPSRVRDGWALAGDELGQMLRQRQAARLVAVHHVPGLVVLDADPFGVVLARDRELRQHVLAGV